MRRIYMNNDDIIDETIDILLNVFNNYCKYPDWYKLQTIFQEILVLGIELGKKKVYISKYKGYINNDVPIKKKIEAILKMFDEYCSRPTWPTLQRIFQLTLLFGIELGYKSVFLSRSTRKGFSN